MKRLLLIFCLCAVAFAGNFHQKPMLGVPLAYEQSSSKGLVACWLMNENAGEIVRDVSLNNYVGTMQIAGWRASQAGMGVQLVASNDDFIQHVSSGSILPGGWGPYTLVWRGVLPVRQSTTLILFGIGDTGLSTRANTVYQSSTADYRFGFSCFGNGSSTVTTGFGGGVISLVLVWESATSRKLYLNGELLITDTDSVTPSGTPNVITCGCVPRNNTTTNNSDQDVSSYYVYNRALSASEVAQLYREPFRSFRREMILSVEEAAVTAAQVIIINM